METIFLKAIKSLNIDLILVIDIENGIRPAFTINGNCYTVCNNWTTEPILSMQNLISELYNKGKTLNQVEFVFVFCKHLIDCKLNTCQTYSDNADKINYFFKKFNYN